MVGILVSFGYGLFSGAMLVSWTVKPCEYKATLPIDWWRLSVINSRPVIFHVWSLLMHTNYSQFKSKGREAIRCKIKQTKNLINMVSRAGTAGQFLQTVVLQVEVAEATEIPKDIFWKCSQAIVLQVE